MHSQSKNCFLRSCQWCAGDWKHISSRTVLDSALFNIFINGFDNETGIAVIKFTADNKLGKAASTLEDQISNWNYLGKSEKSTRWNSIRRIANSYPYEDEIRIPNTSWARQSHCQRQWHAKNCDMLVYFIRESKGSCTILILHLSAQGTAPSWGVRLQKKKDKMKRFWRWWTGVRKGRALPDSPPDQCQCSHLLSQISPSAEPHWCYDITFSYESTSPHALVHLPHCLQSIALQPWVSATGGFK